MILSKNKQKTKYIKIESGNDENSDKLQDEQIRMRNNKLKWKWSKTQQLENYVKRLTVQDVIQ